MLVIVGMRTEEHSLRRQVEIGSDSDCLLRQLKRIFETSYSDAGLKWRNQELKLVEKDSAGMPWRERKRER